MTIWSIYRTNAPTAGDWDSAARRVLLFIFSKARTLKHHDAFQQAIHPSQTEVIQTTFVPSEKGTRFCVLIRIAMGKQANLLQEILRAAQILDKMAQAHAAHKGAVGLELGDEAGHKEMIDAPMLKQVTLVVPCIHSFI